MSSQSNTCSEVYSSLASFSSKDLYKRTIYGHWTDPAIGRSMDDVLVYTCVHGWFNFRYKRHGWPEYPIKNRKSIGGVVAKETKSMSLALKKNAASFVTAKSQRPQNHPFWSICLGGGYHIWCYIKYCASEAQKNIKRISPDTVLRTFLWSVRPPPSTSLPRQ